MQNDGAPGGPDLAMADLSVVDSSNVDLLGVDLAGADLTSVDLLHPSADLAVAMVPLGNRLSVVASRVSHAGTTGSAFNLAFWNMAGATSQQCILEQYGNCYLRDCINPTTSGVTRNAWTTSANAGSVKVTNGTIDTNLTLNASTLYDYSSTATSPYVGRETLTLSVSGGLDVPAFTSSAAFSGAIQITSPTLQSATRNSIDRSKDLVIGWAPVPDTVEITVGQTSASPLQWPDVREVFCRFNGQVATGTVPSNALMRLDSGFPNSYLRVGRASVTTTISGNYGVDFDVTNDTLWDVTFQ